MKLDALRELAVRVKNVANDGTVAHPIDIDNVEKLCTEVLRRIDEARNDSATAGERLLEAESILTAIRMIPRQPMASLNAMLRSALDVEARIEAYFEKAWARE